MDASIAGIENAGAAMKCVKQELLRIEQQLTAEMNEKFQQVRDRIDVRADSLELKLQAGFD